MVDQKNPISRHRREEKAYKNTSFTSLIRSYEVTLPGVKLNLSCIHKKISNSDGSTVVILCGEKKEEEKDQRKQPAACVIRPTVLYMHHFSSFFQIHKELFFFFPFFFECYMSQRAQLKQGREVCEAAWQCCHSEAPWGQVLSFDKHAAETQTWVTSERSKEHLSKRCVNLLWKKHNLVKGWWQ